MKTKIVAICFTLVLTASLVANVWLGATLRTYQYNLHQGWFTCSSDGAPEFPIEGLTATDVKAMLEVLDKEKDLGEWDHRVMTLDVKDRNNVEITTGRLTSNLSGGGRIFHFKRKPSGWELDRRGFRCWVS